MGFILPLYFGLDLGQLSPHKTVITLVLTIQKDIPHISKITAVLGDKNLFLCFDSNEKRT
jgi:hypothetical protein